MYITNNIDISTTIATTKKLADASLGIEIKLPVTLLSLSEPTEPISTTNPNITNGAIHAATLKILFFIIFLKNHKITLKKFITILK